MKKWIAVAGRKDVVTRSLKVAFLVGTLLVLINQGNRLAGGEWSVEIALKIVLTYLVPYCVSTYAGVAAILAAERKPGR